MKKHLKTEMTLVLELTLEEADWLHEATRNPLASGEETRHSVIRENIFDATNIPKPRLAGWEGE